jgi:hypothetical protein
LFTSPIDENTLTKFYNKTRPFGTWNRFKKRLSQDDSNAIDNENKRDIFSTFIAVPWQIIFFLFMMSLMFKNWTNVIVLGILLVVLTTILYFTWFKHLSTEVTIKE